MLETLQEITSHHQIGFPILSVILLLPFAAAVILCVTDRKERKMIQYVTFFTMGLNFILSLLFWSKFKPGIPDMQFVEYAEWIKTLGSAYHVGVDGVSLFLVVLSTFVGGIVSMYLFWVISVDDDRLKEYVITLLTLLACAIGVFIALDLILFYVFWELVLIPIYFFIKMYGGEKRNYTALKFFLYTIAGGIMMLLALIAVFHNYHTFAVANNLPIQYTFNIIELLKAPIPASSQMVIFLLFFIGFAVKVPVFPFHSWLPDTYTQSPMIGTFILSAVLSKMGVYGFLRFSLPLLPHASNSFAPIGAFLAVFGAMYAAWIAFHQTDLKRLIAYSSISHLGFIMLGVFSMNAMGIKGSILQMFNHGISIISLFLLAALFYERRQTFQIKEFGGLFHKYPRFMIVTTLFFLASMGAPGMNNFVGEVYILVGAFGSPDTFLFALLSGGALLMGMAYTLWLFQRLMLGDLKNPLNKEMQDLKAGELCCLIPIAVFILWVGLFPTPFLNRIEGSAGYIGRRLNGSVATATTTGGVTTHQQHKEH